MILVIQTLRWTRTVDLEVNLRQNPDPGSTNRDISETMVEVNSASHPSKK